VRVTRRRLDAELVRRGLAIDPGAAREAIEAGLVTVGGRPASKPATMVGADEALHVTSAVRRYVSRAGDKLRAALDRSGIDPRGLDCLDAGASTGGFTDCLLAAGAHRVVAVDVGYGQLAWELRTDERVIVLERTNVRDLRPADLPFAPALVVADLSFVSLTSVLGPLVAIGDPRASFVLLVKPQFEAGRADVETGGVVRDPLVWHRVLVEVAAAADRAGLGLAGLMASPVRGPAGNVEYLAWGRAGVHGALTNDAIDAAVDEGTALVGEEALR
jgi:23S rRNA (cytidine1920-2'-O)/16S rRNA (cytidine1409-2'-O)-methyltransferase